MSEGLWKFLEAIAPYVSAGIGTVATGYLTILNKKEQAKVENLQRKLDRLKELEDLEENQRNALNAILNQCDAMEHLGDTFFTTGEINQINPTHISFFKSGVSRIQAIAHDVLEDGVFDRIYEVRPPTTKNSSRN